MDSQSRICGTHALPRNLDGARASAGFIAFWRRLAENQDAATAMEFAIVSPVLFAMLLATLQLVLVFLAQAALETACEGAARYVLTGQAQTNFNGVYNGTTLVTTPQQQFSNYVCQQMAPFMGCGYLFADVASGANYSTVNLTEPTWTFNASGNVTNVMNYSPGTQGNIVVVRLFYFWPVISVLGFNITSTTDVNQGGNMFDVLLATSVAKTESYGS